MLAQDQAAYLRKTLTDWQSGAASPKDDQLSALLMYINQYLSENGQPAIDIPSYHVNTGEFGKNLVQFLNQMHHSENPFNAKGELRSRADIAAHNLQLADLYEAITSYLDKTGEPVNRRGAETEKNPANGMLKLWKKTASIDKNGKTCFSIEEVDSVDFSHKAIICCSGTAGTDKTVDGFLDIAEAKLGGKKIYENGAALYAVSYPLAHRSAFFADTHRYNANSETHVSANAKYFLDKVILPQLDGIRHPNNAELKAFLGKLNFFAYSYGTVFVEELRNGLVAALSDIGYKDAEIKDALAEAYAMHVGPCIRLDAEKKQGHFSAIYVVSPNDLSVRSKTDNWRLLEEFAPNERAKALSDNEIIVYSELPLEGRFIADTPACMDESNEQEAARYRMHRNPSGHGLRFYTQPIVNGLTAHTPDYFDYCMKNILMEDQPSALLRMNKQKLAGHHWAVAELANRSKFTGCTPNGRS